MKNLVLLISGRGSNLQAILQAAREQGWIGSVRGVISNKADAAGLDVARADGVPTQVVAHTDFASREDFDQALGDAIAALQPDVIALCGFMRVLGAAFVARFSGRLVNIHPSLLPAFTGLHTHARALESGVKWHGATVHLVTDALDHGPILAQAIVPVLDDDTPQTLAARVLVEEHRIYPAVVRALLEGRVQTDGLRTRILSSSEPLL
jgi:phosphoribosylglycinamide formyltransferase-1